jgi:Acyl-CoA thioesterase C-terminal domain/Acyl-CoA thioesterase N-terminal domain
MPDAFFAVETTADGGEWFVPTGYARGPWDPDACHGGPPTALLARALERTLPELRLARLTADLTRPVPMAGFAIETEIVKAGRATGTTRATIVDADGARGAFATGMHVLTSPVALFPAVLDNSEFEPPHLAEAEPGAFPIARLLHDQPAFNRAIEVRYPRDQDPPPGATTVWMRTITLLPDEEPSPFQRICPLADCGNAFSRHAEPGQVQFINTDLTIALHRDPVGEWLGSRVVSHWQPSGVGLADALLFDDDGPVGRALQTLLLRPAG